MPGLEWVLGPERRCRAVSDRRPTQIFTAVVRPGEVGPLRPRRNERVAIEEPGGLESSAAEGAAGIEGGAITGDASAHPRDLILANNEDGVVEGNAGGHISSGGRVEDEARMFGQAQERLASGVIVAQVGRRVSVRARKLSVVVEHVCRAHRLGELSPRMGWHRALVFHRLDDVALPRVVGDCHAVAVVHSRDARPRVDDAFSLQDFLDE